MTAAPVPTCDLPIEFAKNSSGPIGFPYQVRQGAKVLAWFADESEAEHYTWMLLREERLSNASSARFMDDLTDFLQHLRERLPPNTQNDELEQL